MNSLLRYFPFWVWLRLGRSPIWIVPGMVSLVIFALALTRIDAAAAGRAYAAYGGIYIFPSLLWLWVVEKTRPDQWGAARAFASLGLPSSCTALVVTDLVSEATGPR